MCSSFNLGCFEGTTLNLSISGIQNPPYIVNITDTITLYTTTVQGWHIDKGVSI